MYGQIQWHTSTSYILLYQMPFCQTDTQLLFVTKEIKLWVIGGKVHRNTGKIT